MINRRDARSLVFLGVLAAVIPLARAQTNPDTPTPVEAALLPRFCWKQYMGQKFSGPQYDIPRKSCGVYVNHYCPGLVSLNRANRLIGDPRRKRSLLLTAKKRVLYTLHGISTHPHCPIRAHVETTMRVINAELGAFR